MAASENKIGVLLKVHFETVQVHCVNHLEGQVVVFCDVWQNTYDHKNDETKVLQTIAKCDWYIKTVQNCTVF